MKFPLFSTLALACLLGAPAQANIKLPALISDNMVLQQESQAGIWGWADPGEEVEVTFGKLSAKTIAGGDGKWSVKLADLKAGQAGDLTIAGKNSITVKNVLVGEVWVCSGQSNMEFRVSGTKNAEQEIAAADFPTLRMFTVSKAAKLEPQDDCVGKWEICTPQTAPGFSAVGYFFGRKLVQDLKQPIGLIHSSWGGTPAEYWTPTDVLSAEAMFKPIFENWERTLVNYPKAKEAHEKALEEWKLAAEKAKTEGTPPPPQPRAPRGGDAFGAPSCLYNGMIAPLIPYSVQGAIWYQGEANAGRAKEYQRLFPTMIHAWRQKWNLELPFLFVQLANFNARRLEPTGEPEDSFWAELREAQLSTLELPHTGMAVTIDIGEGNDIHPKNKQDVGLRLALAAEATVYFRDVAYSGPMISSVQEEDGKIRLSFRNADELKPAEGTKLKGFAIAGEDKKFYWALTEIQSDHVVVSSPQVPKPVAVRYNWADNPDGNLVNGAGLPASPFRSDQWPQNPARK